MNKAELLRQWRRRYFFHMFLCICILAVGYIVGAFLHSQIVWYPEAGAISISEGGYYIDPDKCVHCKMCMTAKYLDGGCTMDKYLRTK